MRVLLLVLCCALPAYAIGQQFRGRVYDADNLRPLASVLVTNTKSGAMWVGDSAGNFAFTAYPGDVITLHLSGYKENQLTIFTHTDIVRVGLARAPVQLEEVRVISPMLRYRQDSAFNHQFFRKELGYATSRTKMNYSGGIAAEGIVSELALWASGKKKYYRNFAREMAMLEDMRYASIRYTADMVMAQTGLKDSAASAFILKHPIPNDFVRDASELELKMWVRDQYRASIGDTIKRQ